MSVASAIIKRMAVYNPWAHFRNEVKWDLIWAPLPMEIRAVTDFDRRRVFLDVSLRQVERRCALAHEIVHIERGPAPRDAAGYRREEQIVQRITANRLIGVDRLAEALAWDSRPGALADELWVTKDVLLCRLKNLTTAERERLEEVAHNKNQ